MLIRNNQAHSTRERAIILRFCPQWIGVRFLLIVAILSGATTSRPAPYPVAEAPDSSISTPEPSTKRSVAASRPDRQEVFGYSCRGKPLTAFVFGTGAYVTLILGGIHGDEPVASAVVERLRHFLEHRPESYQGCSVILIPRANPDGLRAHTRANARGVDLNRNFPFEWQPRRAGVRYSAGSAPASEPETRALMRLLEKYHPRKVISIHQPLHCMTWCGPGSQHLAAMMHHWNGYPVPESIGYPTPGSFAKYCGKGLGIAEITLELPAVSSERAWKQNQGALLAAMLWG